MIERAAVEYGHKTHLRLTAHYILHCQGATLLGNWKQPTISEVYKMDSLGTRCYYLCYLYRCAAPIADHYYVA